MFPIFRPWHIGRLFGIPIRIDPSWVLIFLLLVYQLATFIFPVALGVRFRRGIAFDVIALAVIASLLLFASVVAHELAHALMARVRGVSVLGITLFIFGGVAQIGDEPDSPATEFLIAIVGPLISFVIAILAAGIWIWLQALEGLGTFYRTPLQSAWVYIAVVAFYLAQANLLLALFNLLPGFPLDGGRVLRALIWAILKDQKRATYLAMLSGRGMAILMVAVGAFILFRGEYGGGWLLLMAWFLWRAAGEAYHSLLARELLKQVTVGELMRAPLQRVSEALSLRELAESFASWLRPPALAIDLNGNAVGIVGMEQVKQVERAKWESTRVRQAMLPLGVDVGVTSNDTALHALKLLTEREREEVAVIQNGQVVGIIGREELARYLQAQGE
ncbi:MAG: site-2 protease family protein [Chloroflexota bacterium]|nr:MAG: site-2 protease family protein [Chloroflexota bacterium]